MSLKFATIPPKRLALALTSAGSSFYVNNILSFDGQNNVTAADLGTQHYVCFRNDTGTRIEIMEIDPATIESSPITILRRGLSFYGDRTTEDTDLKLDWSANETIVQFGTDVPQIFQYLKEYIDSASIAGAVPASTTAAGILVEASQAETDARTATKVVSAVTYKLFTPLDKVRATKYHDYAADAGSTDAYAITVTPAPTAYATGQIFQFKANTVNTGACTLNVNSLGAKTIKKNYNVDLGDAEIKANQIVTVIYDGTNFQLLSPTPIRASVTTTYNSSDTWTKPANLDYIIVELWGGGGGGASAGSSGDPSGGGGGGYNTKLLLESQLGATETITIGAGGAGGAPVGNNGSDGGTTSFGSHLSAYGGGGGSAGGSGEAGGGGGGGTTSTGGTGSTTNGGNGGGLTGGTGGTATALPQGSSFDGAGGGGPNTSFSRGGNSYYGGAGGGGTASDIGGVGGNSVYGGGGGGGGGNNPAAGGTSVYGGNGGAGTNNATGVAGTAPAGGGGGGENGSGGGAGAAGRCKVTEFYK